MVDIWQRLEHPLSDKTIILCFIAQFYRIIKVSMSPFRHVTGFFGLKSDQLGVCGFILALLDGEKFRNRCCQSPPSIILETDCVNVLLQMIRCYCVRSAYPRSTKAHSSRRTPRCERDVHADRGEMEGVGRLEQDSGWGGRGSLLISHNPPLCFRPTRKLSPEQIHTSPTV